MTESTSERLLVLEKALKEIIKHINNPHLNNKDKITGISMWEEMS